MESSEPLIPREFEPTPACDIADRLSAYFDGEVSTDEAAVVERHLAGCDLCREELNDLREISALADRVAREPLSASAVARIHRDIDEPRGAGVFRIAAALTGLAASVLIVGSVWLRELPPTRTAEPYVIITATDSSWTRVAVDLSASPLPHNDLEVRHQQMFADARLANWMLHSLSGETP